MSYGRRDPDFGDVVSVMGSITLPIFADRRQNPRIAAAEAEAAAALSARADQLRELEARFETDLATWRSAYAGGLRVSELVTLQLRDFPDRSLSTVHIMGKGRRERVLPLWKETQFALRAWLAIRPDAQAAEIFLNANGQPMTRDGFAFRLAEHVKTAATKQPSIHGKRVWQDRESAFREASLSTRCVDRRRRVSPGWPTVNFL